MKLFAGTGFGRLLFFGSICTAYIYSTYHWSAILMNLLLLYYYWWLKGLIEPLYFQDRVVKSRQNKSCYHPLFNLVWISFLRRFQPVAHCPGLSLYQSQSTFLFPPNGLRIIFHFWTEIWENLRIRFRNDEFAFDLFNDYIPPRKNVSQFVLKLFNSYR